MKKEKQVKTHQRRTKSGKVVVVRQHTAKYDAAENMKESLVKKKGSGTEMEALKGSPEIPFGIVEGDFKDWYSFNEWDTPEKNWPESVRRVNKALLDGMGKNQYDKFCARVDESWTARGYKRAITTMSDFAPKTPDTSTVKKVNRKTMARRANTLADEIYDHEGKSYTKEEGAKMLERIKKSGFNMYKQGLFYDGYKFVDLDSGETIWVNVATDKRGRVHIDTMHPAERDEYYNYYEKERDAAKKRDMERQKARMTAIQKVDKRDSWLKTSDIVLEKLGNNAVKGQVIFGKHNVSVIVEPDHRNGGYFINAYDIKTNKSYLYNTPTLSDLSKGVIDRISAKKRDASQGVEKVPIDYGTEVITKGYYKKKLPKGSFRTVDENGNEIPGAPKHGTRSVVSSAEGGKKSKTELSPREKEKQEDEKAMRVFRKNPYLKFTSDNKGVTLKRVTAATAKKMSLDSLVRYVAAETYCFRRGINPSGSLENAALWKAKGRAAILEAFFKDK